MRPKLVCLCLCLAVLPYGVLGQKNDVSDEQPAGKKLEETVVKDMLRIVDHKFDTLTTRITSLERAVSNLQFFSIRQFRQVTGGLQTTGNQLKDVSKQVGQLEVDGRGLKIAMTLLGRDVSALKKTSTDMLVELESSVVYINDNMDKQGESVKEVLKDTIQKNGRDTTSILSRQMDEIRQISQASNEKPKSVNCSVNFANLSEHIDLRFAEFRQQTHSHFVNMINAAKLDVRGASARKNKETDENSESEEVDSIVENSRKEVKATAKGQDEIGQLILGSPADIHKNVSDDLNEQTGRQGQGHGRLRSPESELENENDERVMAALYNMTESVLQAVSYFRNTGRLLEEIVSNTDRLAKEQTYLTNTLGLVHLTSTGNNQENESNSEAINSEPQADEGERPNGQIVSRLGACHLSSELVSNVATIIKNGSQLLEVLTDLAQMSSVSLSKATESLQDEVTRVEGLRTRMATALLSRDNSDESDPVNQLTNTTQRTFKLMEAVASNTGWLPLVFRNVQHIESLSNQSLHVATRNNGLLHQVHAALIHSRERGGDQEDTLSNRIPRIPAEVDNTGQSGLRESSKDEAILDRESLETIYSTSLQLNRIMPALTKLLAEPDPLITLVGGGRADQGRLEIYHKGHWGAVCHRDLSHAEADVICRHLGFKGGISAGAGHFGPGGGVTWTLNTSCLATGRCPVVHYSEESTPCSHEQDAAVICDHMLRIISSEGLSANSKAGRLEIHHKGMWMPVCGEGWSGFSARVACQQMGFSDGREMEVGEWLAAVSSSWLTKVACNGRERRLDACENDGWTESCPGLAPAGVRCL